LTDEELMRAYQEGDMGAFETLYRRHSGRVFGFLLRRLHDRHAVGDIFQTTFLKLHEARHRYDADYPFVPWLFTITQRVLIDHYRKLGLDRRRDILVVAEAGSESGPAVDIPSLGGLSKVQTEAVRLRFGEDLPFEEIAKRLQTTPVNVRQIISRAVRKLRGAR
jgi:RNA polymerase sigma-70 factor, ECF subfamily